MNFSIDRMEHMLRYEEQHFWFRARRRLLRALVRRFIPRPGPFAELGCGSGRLLITLARDGYTVAGVDGHRHGIERLRQEVPGEFLCTSAEASGLASNGFAGVGMFDLLEHVEEAPVLTEARRLLRRDGRLLVAVPACPWLYGEFDRRAGHLRRYSRHGLRSTLESAGFWPLFWTAYQFLLFPVVVWQRLRRRHHEDWRTPPAWLNAVLGRINFLEIGWSARHSLPWGSSWICLAEKR